MRLEIAERVENSHEDALWTAIWNTENTLITGSVDETVKVWNSAELQDSIHTFTGHTLGVISVTTDSSGVYAASSSLDSFIRVWNVGEGSTKAVMETPPSETWQITLHPTATSLTLAAAGGSSHSIGIWNCENAQKEQDLQIPGAEEKSKREKFVLSVAYSPDGARIACGCQDGTVCIFDCQSGTLLHSLEGHYKPVRSLTFTPDSALLLTACDDMHTHLYDAANGALIEAFSGHASWVLSVSCHPDGRTFATGSSDSKVKLWDLSNRACIQTLTDHTDQVWDVCFNKDGSQFASVSDDKSIAFYKFAA